jgi:hypothetical protein
MGGRKMNKDPAIEKHIATIELAKILCGKPCDICKFYGQSHKCMPVYNAEKVANAGYRKASDVAREIFEEIDRLILDGTIDVRNHLKYSDLKKKCTESEKADGKV